MRTGLPRHDFIWIGRAVPRAEMMERLAHLPLSAGFRERFQYNNLTSAAAGHIAEVVTGQSWESLVQARIFDPLGMTSSVFTKPDMSGTESYHENEQRVLLPTARAPTETIAPAGGAINSTVADMARWIGFNLDASQKLLKPDTLKEIHSAQMVCGKEPASPSPNAAYGLGWFVDTWQGLARVSHGGQLHDVNSEVMLLPTEGVGVVAYTNFGAPRLAKSLAQYAASTVLGLTPARTWQEQVALYEQQVVDARARVAALPRVAGTAPSHPLADYAGTYRHPGYGDIRIVREGNDLVFSLPAFTLKLDHLHYDTWTFAAQELFEIHSPHMFTRATTVSFHTAPDGAIAALEYQAEPAVAPARFIKNT